MLGRYQLLHVIATGGMATVYLGRALGKAGFERVVAIKCCHPHLRDDEEFATMFMDEARLAARIHHPNVVSTLDVGEGDALYLVMEYVEGDRLSGLIKAASKKGQRVPVPVAARLMIDLLSGLHAAHELHDAQGAPLHIVHRDVSPQNVLVGVDGVARITDFGIAKAEARATVTREGQVKGKMSYMAPEQVSSSNVTRRADIYAAGVVFWETLTGRRLFRADSDAETLNLVLHGVVPGPSAVAPDVPPEVDAIVRRALERDPEKRFATAEEFAEALENLPFKVATSRAVAGYINELLGETLSTRRDLVRRISEGTLSIPPSDRPEVSQVRPTSTNMLTYGSIMAATLPGVPGVGAPAPEVTVEDSNSSRRRALYVVLAAVAILALAGGVAVGMRAFAPAPVTVTPQVIVQPTPVAVPTPQTAPSTEVQVPAQPTPPPVVTPETSPSAPSVANVAPPNAPANARARWRPRTGTAAPTTTPGTTTAAPPTPPTTTPPSPPGEFRPGSI
jgi:serine/threonine-protein kinase